MAKDREAKTRAIRFLEDNGVKFRLCAYRYEEKGGTRVAARALGVDEHRVVKTLVMEDEKGTPLLILMHGDKQVSTKALARHLGVKAVQPCHPATANRHTGYVVGGTSPFGTRKTLPTYVEATVLVLPGIYVNMGRKGLLAELTPQDLVRVLNPTPVRVAIAQ